MGLPQFPVAPKPPAQKKLLKLLLHTVALEELALAALVNAEAEKVQAVSAAGIVGPVTAESLAEVNKAVAEVITAAGKKEEVLLAKLKFIIAVKDSERDDKDDDC